MKKQIGIIHKNIINGFLRYFYDKDVEIVLFESLKDIKDCDIIALYDYNEAIDMCSVPVLNLHPSLLPSFEGEYAAERAFTSGVKVSGITIQDLQNKKILAQYPIFIGHTTSYNEYLEEIAKITDKLYPIAADSILSDTVFDFAELINSGCSGNCSGGCKGCSHQ